MKEKLLSSFDKIYNDQIEFIPGMQGRLNIKNVISYNKRLKGEKSCDQLKHFIKFSTHSCKKVFLKKIYVWW